MSKKYQQSGHAQLSTDYINFTHIPVMDLNLWVRHTSLLTTPEAEMAPIPTSGKSIWQSMLRKCEKLRMSMSMLESMAIGIWKIPNPCCINGCKLTRSNPIINIQLWVLIITGKFSFKKFRYSKFLLFPRKR